MGFRNGNKTYKIRKPKKGLGVFLTVSAATAIPVIIAVIIIASILVAIFLSGDKNGANASSLIASSSAIVSQESASSVITETESSDIVSSQIAQTEVEAEISSKTSSVSSKAPSSGSSSKASGTSSKVSVNLDGASTTPPYDVYAEAENWTYEIDKSKPVPLQPAVKNSFFSDVMFVGDSITTGIDLYGIVNNAPVVAYTGINTNTVLTREVIKTSGGKVTFLNAMKKYKPKHIYIMMGINGIAFQSKDNLINGYGKFIDSVKKQHPDAVIYLQSILPVTAKKQRNDSRFANSKINDYNKAIAKLAKEKGVYYLNVAEAFKDENGCLPNAASPNDGIHFGPSYYKRWIEYLKRHTVYTGEIPETTTSSKESSEETSSKETSSKETSSKKEESSSSAVSSAESSSRQTVIRDPEKEEK